VVVFCSDHVNDCKSGGMLLGHGPNIMLAHWVEPLPQDVAGATWDGGPPRRYRWWVGRKRGR